VQSYLRAVIDNDLGIIRQINHYKKSVEQKINLLLTSFIQNFLRFNQPRNWTQPSCSVDELVYHTVVNLGPKIRSLPINGHHFSVSSR